MVGRDADVIILHDHQANSTRAEILLKGVSRVLDPPLVVRVNSETRAIQSGLRRLRAGDMLLVLADDPVKALAAVERANRARVHADEDQVDNQSVDGPA